MARRLKAKQASYDKGYAAGFQDAKTAVSEAYAKAYEDAFQQFMSQMSDYMKNQHTSWFEKTVNRMSKTTQSAAEKGKAMLIFPKNQLVKLNDKVSAVFFDEKGEKDKSQTIVNNKDVKQSKDGKAFDITFGLKDKISSFSQRNGVQISDGFSSFMQKLDVKKTNASLKLHGAMDSIKTNLETAQNWVDGKFDKIDEAIEQRVDKMVDGIETAGQNLSKMKDDAVKSMKDTKESVVSGAKSVVTSVKQAPTNMKRATGRRLAGFGEKLSTYGQSMQQMYDSNTIDGEFKEVVDSVEPMSESKAEPKTTSVVQELYAKHNMTARRTLDMVESDKFVKLGEKSNAARSYYDGINHEGTDPNVIASARDEYLKSAQTWSDYADVIVPLQITKDDMSNWHNLKKDLVGSYSSIVEKRHAEMNQGSISVETDAAYNEIIAAIAPCKIDKTEYNALLHEYNADKQVTNNVVNMHVMDNSGAKSNEKKVPTWMQDIADADAQQTEQESMQM